VPSIAEGARTVTTSTNRKRAVVIGAGIAGLSAARVLADRFDQVTVVDRDLLPDTAVPRRGASQSAHAHVLLVAGERALEELFPGLRDELVRAGATQFDPGLDLRMYRYGRRWDTRPSELRLLSQTRPLLELTVRRRVAALPNVTVRGETAVSGLEGADGRVTGVRLDDGTVLPADLTVDCSGRGSRSDRWLSALGMPAPESVEVRVGVGYATRLLRRTPGDLTGAQALFVLPAPPEEKRLGVALPVEGDRWVVGLGGWHGEHPSTDEAGFMEHARSLPDPMIADLLEKAEPVSDIVTFRYPANRRRRFERLRLLPAGYVASGDAICSFNPIYGQGMTCAAMEALALGQVLGRHPDTSAAMTRDFYRATARVLATPWQFATGGDFAYPETVGRRSHGTDLMNRYARQIQLASQVSPEVGETFLSVQHLVTPPRALFMPLMVGKVLRAARARARQSA
jgi:2-polyprenyl-6-methoxyphenol hydroxylase-like FAD-dependent oxidoreductase